MKWSLARLQACSNIKYATAATNRVRPVAFSGSAIAWTAPAHQDIPLFGLADVLNIPGLVHKEVDERACKIVAFQRCLSYPRRRERGQDGVVMVLVFLLQAFERSFKNISKRPGEVGGERLGM